MELDQLIMFVFVFLKPPKKSPVIRNRSPNFTVENENKKGEYLYQRGREYCSDAMPVKPVMLVLKNFIYDFLIKVIIILWSNIFFFFLLRFSMWIVKIFLLHFFAPTRKRFWYKDCTIRQDMMLKNNENRFFAKILVPPTDEERGPRSLLKFKRNLIYEYSYSGRKRSDTFN